MSRSTSLTFREAVYAQETDEAFIILITMDHDDFTTPVRVSSDGVDTVSNGDTYTAFPFDLTLPDDGAESGCVGRITIDNVSREIVEALREIESPPSFDIQVVLSSDPDTVEASFTGFVLRHVTYDALTVQGDITIEDYLREPYPGGSFTPAMFPGLF